MTFLIRLIVSIHSRRIGIIEIASKKCWFEESSHNFVFCKDDPSQAALFSTIHNDNPINPRLLIRSLPPMIHFRSLILKSQDLLLVRRLSLKILPHLDYPRFLYCTSVGSFSNSLFTLPVPQTACLKLFHSWFALSLEEGSVEKSNSNNSFLLLIEESW